MNDLKVKTIKGVNNLSFEKITREAEIQSPLQNFELVTQKIEYRKDPLLNHWSRINALRAERVKQAKAPGENYDENLDALVNSSANKCFFCPENVLKSTPKFPAKLQIGERIIVGDFSLFPNLFVFSEFHAVGVLGTKHFTPLNEIKKETWKNALIGSKKFFEGTYNHDSEIRFPSINFNYLPPSASSIIHPHIQIIQDIQPTKLTEQMISQSKHYFEKSNNKNNYWIDLIESEKMLNERFIAENDSMAWLATYSPIGKNELTGILKIPKTDITQLTDEELDVFAEGIQKALTALYEGRGARSVNMAIYLGAISEDISNHYRINLKIVSRPLLLPNYTADVGFMEMLHQETIGEASPEVIAESVKEFF